MKNAIIIVLVLVVAVLLLYFLPRLDQENDKAVIEVNSYHECLDAGYTILETFPAQCRTPDGKVFTDDVNEPVEVVINTPERGAVVNSPLTVTGKAKGNWFFEDNLPITLKDQNGKVLAQVGARSNDGNWMTADFVNFTAVLTFEKPATEFGVLLVEKDNPSGMPENDASYAIPVRFK